jgi:predicted nucleotidyltransferase
MPIRPEILSKRAEVAELCRRFHVQTLEVFGSAATGRFDPDRSDIDFLAEFAPAGGDLFHRFFGLIEELERLFDRPIDLLTPRSIRNKYLLASINRTRTTLYAA